jgi:hypothetical protein
VGDRTSEGDRTAEEDRTAERGGTAKMEGTAGREGTTEKGETAGGETAGGETAETGGTATNPSAIIVGELEIGKKQECTQKKARDGRRGPSSPDLETEEKYQKLKQDNKISLHKCPVSKIK